jgi:hypothetical protein
MPSQFTRNPTLHRPRERPLMPRSFLLPRITQNKICVCFHWERDVL